MIRQSVPFVIALMAAACSASLATAQPAPALTAEYVVGVKSTGYTNGQQWDYVPQGAFITPGNHTGPELLVAVYEQGYANNQIAFFNGMRMQLLQSQPLVNAQSQIYGYIRYYYIQTPFTSGTFRCQSTSINFPFNTLSTSLSIK